MITQLKLGTADGVSVSLVSPWPWRLAGAGPGDWRRMTLETGGGWPGRLAGDTLNITCNFLHCNYQVHRDFLITLYYHSFFSCKRNTNLTFPLNVDPL
jgi:hypothetical protein